MKERSKRHLDLVASALMMLVGIYGLVTGFGFGVFVDGRPGAGFQPVFASTILFVSSVCLFVQSLRAHKSAVPEQEPSEEEKAAEEADRRDKETPIGRFLAKIIPNARLRYPILIFLSVFLTIKIIDYCGMYAGLFLMNFLFLWFISKYSVVKSAAFAALISLALFAVFSLALGISVPTFMNRFV